MKSDSIGLFGTNQQRGQDYNKLVVFEHIRLHGPVSRTEVAADTRLVLQTVSNLVRALMNEGLVVEKPPIQSHRRRGAAPMQLSVRDNARVAIGLQIQYSRAVGALVDLSGKVLAREELGLADSGYLSSVSELSELAQTLMAQVPETGDLLGIGVGLPSVDGGRGDPPQMSIHTSLANHLRETLQNRFQTTVLTANNAKMATVGEYWKGKDRVFRSFLYVYLGDNVGGGVMLDGEVYLGPAGHAIELGHTQYVPDGLQCYCGARGCLDQYGSATAIRRRLRLSPDEPLASAVARAKSGDEEAARVLLAAATAIADTIVNAYMLFGVQNCVIGGPHADDLYNWIAPAVVEVTQERRISIDLLCSSLGIDAGAIGAASAVFHDALWCKPSNLFKV